MAFRFIVLDFWSNFANEYNIKIYKYNCLVVEIKYNMPTKV